MLLHVRQVTKFIVLNLHTFYNFLIINSVKHSLYVIYFCARSWLCLVRRCRVERTRLWRMDHARIFFRQTLFKCWYTFIYIITAPSCTCKINIIYPITAYLFRRRSTLRSLDLHPRRNITLHRTQHLIRTKFKHNYLHPSGAKLSWRVHCCCSVPVVFGARAQTELWEYLQSDACLWQ